MGAHPEKQPPPLIIAELERQSRKTLWFTYWEVIYNTVKQPKQCVFQELPNLLGNKTRPDWNPTQTKSHVLKLVMKIKSPKWTTYLCYLDTPVQQELGANIVLVFMDIIQEAAMRHQLSDQLNGGAQADTQESHQVWVVHAGHDESFLQRQKWPKHYPSVHRSDWRG